MSDRYFKSDVTGEGELRIVRGPQLQRLTVADGVHLHPLMGERLNVNVVVIEAGAEAVVHTHAEEQMGYVVSGECEFSDGTTTWRLGPGDTYHAAPGVPHGARAFDEPCVIIDAFSPPRAGLEEMLEARD